MEKCKTCFASWNLKKNISTILKFVHDRLQKRKKEIRYKRHQNQIFPKKKKILPLPLILLKAQTPPPSKITTSNTFINTIPSHRHHPPTFLITRSNTLPKQRWRKKFGLDIVSHNSPLPPPRPGETRIHRDKTNPCPDKWRLAGTVLKGREFETTINPGQRLINRRPKHLGASRPLKYTPPHFS